MTSRGYPAYILPISRGYLALLKKITNIRYGYQGQMFNIKGLETDKVAVGAGEVTRESML